MKIIADENMPNAKALFSHLGDVCLVDGRQLTKDQLQDAEVLLVRSVTKVTPVLLEGTQIKFVGSATIGVDHIDQTYLQQQGIQFASAPGCNAEAVADYVFSALSSLYFTKSLNWCSKRIGIIGFGNVGQIVCQRFVSLGLDVVVHDPFKANQTIQGVNFVGLEEVMQSDILCLHAPLTTGSDFPTKGMIDAPLLAQLPENATIISAGRGGIIDEAALIQAFHARGGAFNLVLDVWSNEPEINRELFALVDIATPHIAGYSKQGREKGTWMVFQALCEFLRVSVPSGLAETAISAGWVQSINIFNLGDKEEMIARAIHGIYNLARDDAAMRYQYRMQKHPRVFDWLRKNYTERDELNSCYVSMDKAEEGNILKSVGFSVDMTANNSK
ncbi:4-phosphoerythronate dehydrogenase [Marinomonas sp.]